MRFSEVLLAPQRLDRVLPRGDAGGDEPREQRKPQADENENDAGERRQVGVDVVYLRIGAHVRLLEMEG